MAGELSTAPQPESWTQLEQWVALETIQRIAAINADAGQILGGAVAEEPEMLQAIAEAVEAWREQYAVDVLAGVLQETLQKYAGTEALPA
jgi:hypothetical protein